MELILAILSFALGVLIKKYFVKQESLKYWINKYLIYIGLPFVVLYAASNHSDLSISSLVIASAVIGLVLTFVMYFIINKSKLKSKDKASLFLCSTYGNTAFLGIPLAFLFFGNEGALIAGILSFIMLLFHYSLGIILANRLSEKRIVKGFLSYFKRPFIWILLFALILTRLNISFPKEFGVVSIITSLLSVLIIGMSFDSKYITLKNTYLSFFKLFLAPFLALMLLIILQIPNKAVIVLLFATPSALTNTALAIEFKFNEKLSSGLTSISTIIFLAIICLFVIITTS